MTATITTRYPAEILDANTEDDGTMVASLHALRDAVVGHRIVGVGRVPASAAVSAHWSNAPEDFMIDLDNGTHVRVVGLSEDCAHTAVEAFVIHPDRAEFAIAGVGTTDNFTTWHLYGEAGDVLELAVDWSCGDSFDYTYGFDITVES